MTTDMMNQRISSSKDGIIKEQTEKEIGTRCHICTGCGRCVGGQEGIHILTESTMRADAENMSETVAAGDARTQTGADETTTGADEVHLIAVDIGTTTIAMQLHGLDGKVLDTFATVNLQTVYGADVLSRIQAAEDPEAAKQMQEMVRDVLRQGIERFREHMNARGCEGTEQETPRSCENAECAEQAVGISLRMIIAANTTMVYLLMGYDTAELGRAPFHASHLEPIETEIEGVTCHIFPGLSAFVGGDIVAGILACDMNQSEQITLLIDLGTNGEMVLGNREKMIACSTAAGPAFEGGVNRGVWGADMVSLLARLRTEGILDETGLLADPYFKEGVRIGDVCVTQESVRAIQLAKGAIMAGINILVREYGIAMEQIDRVVLAGGFGYYLDPKAAADIKLLPKELEEKTVTGGNTALAGALRWGQQISESENEPESASAAPAGGEAPDTLQPQSIKIINLAAADGFQDLYIDSMNF